MCRVEAEAQNFNPRSPRGERQGNAAAFRRAVISTHAPREGSDPAAPMLLSKALEFQPTLPARGATRILFPPSPPPPSISTHAPREGSDRRLLHARHRRFISTHAPRERSDGVLDDVYLHAGLFQPALPARGATDDHAFAAVRSGISTRAPREGSDARLRHPIVIFVIISTRAPREGSDIARPMAIVCRCPISTRAPREGSDVRARARSASIRRFQPALPARGATAMAAQMRGLFGISTRAPREGSDTSGPGA